MKIAYNPITAEALAIAPANNDITFDLSGLNIFVRGVKFKGTDTTYSVFKKHTSSSGGGYNGLVPVPSYTSTNTRFLREDGTWQTITVSSYNYSQLIDENLNDYKTEGRWYYMPGSNTVTNGPTGINNGGEIYIGRNASGYRYQKAILLNGQIWFRIWNASTWSSWTRWYTDANTDSKVLQSATTTSNFRPIILGYNNDTSVSNLSASVTNQVYTTTSIYAQPSTGSLWANKLYSGGKQVITEHQSLSNYVTINTSQTITGAKIFSTLLTANRIKITNTEAVKHIEFSRSNFNYITAPTSGSIAFVVEGQAPSSATSELIISNNKLYPGTTNVTYLGQSSLRWSNVYSVLGNFSGTVTSNGFNKNGSSDSYVLLGGGGHKALSDFALSTSLNNYVTINTNQTITGIKTFSTQQKFTVASGTAPFTVTSSTVVTNLNADLLDGLQASDLRYTQIYNPANGILIQSDIGSSNNVMINARITGNSYSAGKIINTYFEAYNYQTDNAILNARAINYGLNISYINVFNYNGKICLWIPKQTSYESFSVYLEATNISYPGNRVLSITDAVMPTTGVTRLVKVTPLRAALITDNVASATKLQTARSINGTDFDGTKDIVTAYWGPSRTITLAGAVTGSVSINGTANVTLNTTLTTSTIDGKYVGGNKQAGHGANATSYTADTYSSTFVNKSYVAFAERGSWAYAKNGYITTDFGNIHLAGTAIFQWGASDTNKTQLFITPLNAAGVSSPLLGEMLYYSSNGSGYTSGWTRVVTNRNYTSIITKIGTTTKGSAIKGIYLNSGTPTEMTYSLAATVNSGATNKLAYYSSATAVNDWTTSVGSSTLPIYINAGTPTACSSTLGVNITGRATKLSLNPSGLSSATYGDYMGIIQDSTTGPSNNTWYNKIKILHSNTAGYYTELAQSFTGTEGLWHRRNVAGTVSSWKALLDSSNYTSYVKKIGTATVGSITKPIYLNAGTPTASNATVGTASRPIYMSGGNLVVGTYTFGNASGNAAINNGTVNTNLNADMLDGYNETSFFRHRGLQSIASAIPTSSELTTNNKLNGSWQVSYPGASGHLVQFCSAGSAEYLQLYTTYNGNLLWRKSQDTNLTKAWRTIIDTSNYTSYIIKIGRTTVGATNKPIYLNAGTPTALSATQGSAALPVYLSAGSIVACTASSVFSNLSNSGNNISVTVAGQNRTLTVGYATNAGSLGNYYKVFSFTKNDNSGRPTYILIANVTNWYNATSGDSQYGIRGLLVGYRSGNRNGDGVSVINATVAYRKGYQRLHIDRTDTCVFPKVVLYNGVYYLALYCVGSGFTFHILGSSWGTITNTQLNCDSSGFVSGLSVVYDTSYYGIAGNAATSSRWITPRTLTLSGAITGSVSIDGSTNVKLNTTYVTSTLDSRYVLKSGDTMTGPLVISTGALNNNYNEGVRITAANNGWAGITFGSTGNAGAPTSGWFAARNPGNQFIISPGSSSNTIGLTLNSGGNMMWRDNVVWHAGNDGSGSELDADLLDGVHASTFMRATNANGYYGLTTPAGSSSDWIRTTVNGIIPYQSGGSTAGHGSIGTSSWYFKAAYIQNVYGTFNGTATNADKVDGYHAGNSSGQVAVSNGTVCSNLNADLLDGYHASSFESYRLVVIDASGLNNNTWYPVTMSIGNSLQTRIRIEGNTSANASWNSRSDKSMALILDYTVNGSSWGWTSVSRAIHRYEEGAGTSSCLRGLGQLTNSSIEYVFVRGGAKYNFYVSRFITPVIRTSTYTSNSQSVSPTTTAPAAITRNVAFITDKVSRASVADKLGTSTVGGSTTPIYLSSGSPVACSASTAATVSTIAVRDSSGDIWCRLVRSTYTNQSTISGALAFRVNNSSDNYVRFCSNTAAIRTWLGVASSSHTHTYYWANIKVSTSSSTSTSPTFNTAYTSNWFRSTGKTGWYSETYGGGIYMTDSTYVRVYNSKRFYASGGYLAPYTGSSWLSMATRTNCIVADQNNSASSAHALFRVKNSSGHAIAFGGLGVSIGFYGFYASRISSGSNGTDWSTVWNAGTGVITHSKTIYTAGYYHSSVNSNNYVLLAGGSYKNLADFAKGNAGASNRGVYVTSGTVKAMTYYLNATINSGSSGKLAYYSGDNSIDNYTSTKGSSVKPIYLNAGVPTECTYIRRNGGIKVINSVNIYHSYYQFGPIIAVYIYITGSNNLGNGVQTIATNLPKCESEHSGQTISKGGGSVIRRITFYMSGTTLYANSQNADSMDQCRAAFTYMTSA